MVWCVVASERERARVSICGLHRPYYDAQDAPRAKALQARVAARPRIAAYLESERCKPWDTDSMM